MSRRKRHEEPSEEVVVLYRTSLHNTVFDACRSRSGWSETDSDTDWDFNWADVARVVRCFAVFARPFVCGFISWQCVLKR